MVILLLFKDLTEGSGSMFNHQMLLSREYLFFFFFGGVSNCQALSTRAKYCLKNTWSN